MKRIIITEKQLEKIILFEEENNIIDNDVLLAINYLSGSKLSGLNLDRILKKLNNQEFLNKIKNVLESENNIKNLIKNLESKGLKNPTNFLKNNSKILINNFNKFSVTKLDSISQYFISNI